MPRRLTILSGTCPGNNSVLCGLLESRLITDLSDDADFNLFVKSDRAPERLFHAGYLETQHAIIRIDRGFDLFKQNGGFRRHFFTLHKAESSHLKECRDLPAADFDDASE